MCKTIVFRVLFSYTMNEIPGRIRLSVKLIRCMHLLQNAKKKCEHNEDEYDAEEGKNLSSLGHI